MEVTSSEETSPAVSPSQDPAHRTPSQRHPYLTWSRKLNLLLHSLPPLLISFPPLLSEDPQTSTDPPFPLLPEDPANIALFVDVSQSADLLNVLPHVDASPSPISEFPHPFSTAAPTLKIPLSTALTGVLVCVTFQFYTPEPEPEPRGDSKWSKETKWSVLAVLLSDRGSVRVWT